MKVLIKNRIAILSISVGLLVALLFMTGYTSKGLGFFGWGKQQANIPGITDRMPKIVGLTGSVPNGFTVGGLAASWAAKSGIDVAKSADVALIGKLKEIKPSYKFELTEEFINKIKEKKKTHEASYRQEEESRTVYTDVVFEVEQYIKAGPSIDSNKKEIIFRLIGGSADGLTMKLSDGFAWFEEGDIGQRFLLMPSKDGLGKTYIDDGKRLLLGYGTYRIEDDYAVNEYFPKNSMLLSDLLDAIKPGK